MSEATRPLVLCSPEPRSLDLIFTDEARAELATRYELLEVDPGDVDTLDPLILAQVRYIIGQPPLGDTTLSHMTNLRCILNVESNLMANMTYSILFELYLPPHQPNKV